MDNNTMNKKAVKEVISEFNVVGLIVNKIIYPIIKHICLWIIMIALLFIPYIGWIFFPMILILWVVRLTFDIVSLISYCTQKIKVTDTGIEGKAGYFRSFKFDFEDIEYMIGRKSGVVFALRTSPYNETRKIYYVDNAMNRIQIVDTFYRRKVLAEITAENEEKNANQ